MFNISVLMPVWNVAPYIREALDSVLAQSYPATEIIVSDNASTDGTSEILKAYERFSHVVVTRNYTNMAQPITGGRWPNLPELTISRGCRGTTA